MQKGSVSPHFTDAGMRGDSTGALPALHLKQTLWMSRPVGPGRSARTTYTQWKSFHLAGRPSICKHSAARQRSVALVKLVRTGKCEKRAGCAVSHIGPRRRWVRYSASALDEDCDRESNYGIDRPGIGNRTQGSDESHRTANTAWRPEGRVTEHDQ